jgi:LVIVD repeat-containing protein
MSNIRRIFAGSHLGRVCMIFSAAAVVVFPPGMAANTKPTELLAKVIAHVPLQDAPGSEMLLQTKGNKHYLYVQKASRQGFIVVDVTKPGLPSLVNRSAPLNDGTAGELEMVSPDLGLAEVPDNNSKEVIRRTDNPTKTVKILDLSDPSHPNVLQTFTSVSSIVQDPSRGLIYLANNQGLWILNHPRPGFTPAKNKRPCGSEDAISAMPPDCQ